MGDNDRIWKALVELALLTALALLTCHFLGKGEEETVAEEKP